MAPFPSLTKTWHDKVYPAIDASRLELSCKGKVIAITGAGGTIGRELARQSIRAGATQIALLGRREATLNETKTALEKEFSSHSLTLETIHADISDADSMRGALGNVKKDLGEVDVMIANAAYMPTLTNLLEADEEEWMKGFETNAKGAFHTIRALAPVAKKGCVLVDVSTCPVGMAPEPTMSGYVASKAAATRVYEIFGVEQDAIEVVHVHPGVVDSTMSVKSGVAPLDDVNLPASFIVWAVSDEAKFVRGKFLWANWDVDELKGMKDKISGDANALAIRLNGWPFGGKYDGSALKH